MKSNVSERCACTYSLKGRCDCMDEAEKAFQSDPGDEQQDFSFEQTSEDAGVHDPDPGWVVDDVWGRDLMEAVDKVKIGSFMFDRSPQPQKYSDQPSFDRACRATLEESLEVQAQRGDEYGDTWAIDNMVATFTKATLDEVFPDSIYTMEQVRLIVMAALIDVKDSRMIGAWKEDTVLDGVNYRAAYNTFRKEYEASKRGE